MRKHNKDDLTSTDDLTVTGRDETEVNTLTMVEDRTDDPADGRAVEYHSEEQKLDNGTILTSYGEPKGAA